MDEIVDSEQLAELESLLYSQIHYSVDNEPALPEMPVEPSKTNQNMYAPPRYFGKHLPAPSQERTTFVNLMNPPLASTNSTTSVSSSRLDEVQTLHIHQPIHFKMPNFYQPPVNNIVFMAPNVPPLSKNQRKKLNKQMKKTHEMTVQQAIHDAEVFRHLNREDRARVIKMQKRQRYMARRKEKQKLLKEQQLIQKFNDGIKDNIDEQHTHIVKSNKTIPISSGHSKPVQEVIELSETDEDEIVAIEPSYDTVVVSSDEEGKTIMPKTEVTRALSVLNDEDDGSVQFVEIPAPEPIVLDADPEIEARPLKTDAEMMKPPSDPDTASLSSAASAQSSDKNSNAPLTPRRSPRVSATRRRELLNTPESSNDFLDTTLDVSQQNFNFSLHGNDLGVEKEGVLKPRTLAETYESESSCSASDISSVKNPVFNELEFESPAKQLFAEADLGSFSEYITPKRNVGIPSLLTASADNEKAEMQPGFSKNLIHTDCSDSESSSESELEDETVKVAVETTKRKRLPSLSHFEVDDTQSRSKPMSKSVKTKKVGNTYNKFDFIKDVVKKQQKNDISGADTPKSLEKKAKKRKQKYQEESKETVQTSDNDAVDLKFGSRKKRKRQKSKSDTELEKTTLAKSPQKGIKKRNSIKSDSEVDDANDNTKKLKKTVSSTRLECDKSNKTKDESVPGSEEADSSSTGESPVKRRKRKSRSESNLESSPVLEATANNKKNDKIVEVNEVDLPLITHCVEQDELNDTSVSDVQIIEVPPECIYLSSGDDDDKGNNLWDVSTDEENHFACEELDSLKTDLKLSNVENDLHNSWVVRVQPNNSIVDDTAQDDSTNVAADTATYECLENQPSWCTPAFDLDRAWEAMTNDPGKWKILERDRIHIRMEERGVRCKKCREFGHMSYNCDRNIMRCWLCGEVGHQEPRCPNTVCTSCGRATRFFTANCGRCKDVIHSRCNYCDTTGHVRYLCPDLWRRYHLTTEPGGIVQSTPGKMILKNAKDRWCSGCAKPGHFEHTCNYYNRTHLRAAPYIHKYVDVYNITKSPKKRRTDAETKDTRREEPEEDNRMEEGNNSVQHKEIEFNHQLNKDASKLLKTPEGKDFLKSLFSGLLVLYEHEDKGESGVLKLRGYPTELLAVGPIINSFLAEPHMSTHQVKLSNRNWDILLANVSMLHDFTVNCNLAVTLDPITRSVCFKGDVFSILLGGRNLMAGIAGQIRETFKLKADSLENIRLHPQMKVLADKFLVKWNIKKDIFTLIGVKDNIDKMKGELGNFTRKGMKGTYRILEQVNELMQHADYPHRLTTDFLDDLIRTNNYSRLNVIMLRGDLRFEKLEKLRDLVRVQMFLDHRECSKASLLIRCFGRKHCRQFYIDLLKNGDSMHETSALELYSLGDPSGTNDQSSYFMDLTQRQLTHLLDTPEGNDFLNELNSSFPMEVKKDVCKLCLYCTENQREVAIKNINFYFLILNFDFPHVASEIFLKLRRRLAVAKLDYYTTNCRALYENTRGVTKSRHMQRLHGLLFSKYEFLDGGRHVDTIKHYMQILPCMKDTTVSVTNYRRIKMAAMYLFCPVPMDIDYEMLISLAVSPIIGRVPSYLIKTTLAMVKNIIRKGLARFRNLGADGIKTAELEVIDEYLRENKYSLCSVEVANMFLYDNGSNSVT